MNQQSRQELDKLLEDWQQWPDFHHRPQVRRKLGGGAYNDIWLLANDTQHAVLRRRRPLRGDVPPPPGRLDFAHEVSAARRASWAHLAPAIRYSDTRHQYMLLEYLPQSAETALGKGPLTRGFAQIMRTLAQLSDKDLPRMDYRRWVLELWNAAAARGPAVLTPVAHWRALLLRAATHLNRDISALCHNDINPGNVLMRESQLQLVDWEYAAIGNPYMDLASIIHHFPVIAHLLRKKDYPDAGSLLAARTLTSFSNYIWHRAMEPQADQAAIWHKELGRNARQLHSPDQVKNA